MEKLAYYNGKIGLPEEISIPYNDRAHWFGDGVYDAGPCCNYHIFALEEHIDRFFRSAAELRIEIPLPKRELYSLLCDLAKKVDTGDLFIYFQVTRGGYGDRLHTYEKAKSNLWITMTPEKLNEGREPIQLITTEDTRYYHCNIKTLNLIPNVMAAQAAKEAGAFESVFYRPGGRVTECAHSNVHILKDGVLKTAPTDKLILPGIGRAHLIQACKALGIGVVEEPFTVREMHAADEVIVTSSSDPCLNADDIDGWAVGGKDPETLNKLRNYLLDEIYTACEVAH